MPTEILRPNAAGSYTNIQSQWPTASEHWDKVDEVVADDAITFVFTDSYETEVRDFYNLQSGTLPLTSTVNSVTVYFRFGQWSSGLRAWGTPYLLLNGNETTGTRQDSINYEWRTFSEILARPGGGSWTVSDLANLQVGVGLQSIEGYSAGLTQVYVEVDYTFIDYPISSSVSLGLAPTVTRTFGKIISSSASLGQATTVTKAGVYSKSASLTLGLDPTTTVENDVNTFLCIASQNNGSIKTIDRLGASWTDCAKDAGGALNASYFTQFDNRLCAINYQNIGFSYSAVNDIVSNWTEKPNFPNLPQRFTGMFVGKDASDDKALYFLTPTGMYYLDVFTNFVFGPTEVTWEEDSTSGKKGLYWKGDTYVAVGKGIYKISQGVVSLVGPDMDDGLPEDLQGAVTDMIGVGFWLVIAIDGGTGNKSSILKKYINGKHWHPVYVTSTVNSSIKTLFWDNGTLYFGEGTNVKSLSLPAVTDNVNKLSTQTRVASGSITYPYFHSIFETMPKVAHKVWATTRDCNSNEKITISYRKDEETSWTSLGSFTSSPRPTALVFPASGDSIGVQFEKIQLKAGYARGDTTTNSPKVESLILEYRVIPPTLWGWTVKVMARTSGDQKGDTIIEALKTAIETNTLLSFYPTGDKSKTQYWVTVKGMPGSEAGTEFGQEGIYEISLQEVVG